MFIFSLPDGLFVDYGFALLANPHRFAIIRAGETHTGYFAALRADQHDIGNVDGGLEADFAGGDGASLRLDLALMLGAQVYALNHNPAVLWQHTNDFAALAFIFQTAVDYFDRITFMNFQIHRFAPAPRPKLLPARGRQFS